MIFGRKTGWKIDDHHHNHVVFVDDDEEEEEECRGYDDDSDDVDDLEDGEYSAHPSYEDWFRLMKKKYLQ